MPVFKIKLNKNGEALYGFTAFIRLSCFHYFGGGGGGGGGIGIGESSSCNGPIGSSTQLAALTAMISTNTYLSSFIFQWICGGT